MGQVKRNTTWIPMERMFRLENAHPSWEMHPEWIQALKALDGYNGWVCEVVMPIAFQWIEEHKSEVYRDIPSNLQDDVGTVIDRAFKLVKEQEAYKRGLDMVPGYENEIMTGKLPTEGINPVWQQVSKAFDAARDQVMSTYRQFFPNSGDLSKPIAPGKR
jgi:hypothetical protein